jgi:O-antigen ligase
LLSAAKKSMDYIKIFLILTILSLIPGQLLRLSLTSSSALNLTDILVFLTAAAALPYFLAVKKSLILEKRTFVAALIFSLAASASTILALNSFTPKEVLISGLFLVRFILYFAISIVVANTVKSGLIDNWLKLFLLTAALILLLGFAQILIFPDLTFLVPFGWDPHQQRIVSTFLDPNFAGIFFSFALAVSLGMFIKDNSKIYIAIAALFFAGIVLTFSRSSYLALVTTVVVFGLLKSPKLLGLFSAFFLLAFLLIPNVRSRIAGAASIDETSRARIESWQKALTIFSRNPVFGVGFNTYRYAQNKYGHFSFDEPSGGHSGSGSDSSILLVAATTGIVGLSAFVLLLFSILLKFAKKATSSHLHLAAIAAFFALVVHSQFVNSLFFPQIMLPLWFIVGLVDSYDS